MVVGSYRMTDFNLETIPPGVIDHREWTPGTETTPFVSTGWSTPGLLYPAAA